MSKLGKKILRMFMLVALVAVVIIFSTYVLVFQKVESDLKAKVKNCITESAKSIDGDKFEAVVKANSGDSKEFKDMLNSMLLFKAKQDIKNYYTYMKIDDKAASFVVDASPEPADFGEKYAMQEEMQGAFNGNITVTAKPYTDKWGTYVSAYAPIKNSSGKIVAIVGADADISIFQAMRSLFLVSFLIAMVLFAVLSLIIVLIFSRKLQNNIKVIQSSLDKMGNGDLTEGIVLKTKDEIEVIGNSINEFRLKISAILGSMKNNANDVLGKSEDLSNISLEMASSSQNVSAVIQQVAEGSSSQASGLISINNTVSGFGEQIESIASSIGEVDNNAKVVNLKAKENNDDLNVLVKSVNDTSSAFKDVVNRVNGLGNNISRINEITNLINDIADQTNLLALNAAIEAARAGEAGRGFAVVADEIRKLAEQSKDSSENINKILEDISAESNAVVGTTDDVNNRLVNQVDVIKKATSSFKEIINVVEAILPKIDTVNKSAGSINRDKDEIIRNIETASTSAEEISSSSQEIASLSEELTASTEEVAATAERLSSMMNEMTQMINQFKLK